MASLFQQNAYSQLARKSVDNYLTCYSELEDVDYATTEAAADIAFSSNGRGFR